MPWRVLSLLALLLPVIWAEEADVISVPDIEAEGKSSQIEAGPENEAELEEEARDGEEEAKNGKKKKKERMEKKSEMGKSIN